MTPHHALTVTDAAARLGVTVSALQKLTARGKGPPPICHNGGVFYSERDIDAYLRHIGKPIPEPMPPLPTNETVRRLVQDDDGTPRWEATAVFLRIGDADFPRCIEHTIKDMRAFKEPASAGIPLWVYSVASHANLLNAHRCGDGRDLRKRRAATDDLLAQVAQVYRENLHSQPLKAIAAQLDINRGTVPSYVRKARAKGFLSDGEHASTARPEGAR